MSVIAFRPVTDPNDARECGICLDSANDKPKVEHDADTSQEDRKVQHVFHKGCLTSWLSQPTRPNSCPFGCGVIDLTSLFSPQELQTFLDEKTHEIVKLTQRLNRAVFETSVSSALVSSFFISCIIGFSNDSGYNIEGLVTSVAIIYLTRTLVMESAFLQGSPGLAATSSITSGLTSLFHLFDPLSIRSSFLTQLPLRIFAQVKTGPTSLPSLFCFFLPPLTYSAIAIGISRLFGPIKYTPVRANADQSFSLRYASSPIPYITVCALMALQIGINAKQYFYS